jgi:hypothetical protein
LSKETELLSKEQESIKRKFNELLNEKIQLENLLISHEKLCNKVNKKINIDNINQTNPSQKNQNINQQQHQQLIRIKKEEINKIIQKSSERKIQKNSSNLI